GADEAVVVDAGVAELLLALGAERGALVLVELGLPLLEEGLADILDAPDAVVDRLGLGGTAVELFLELVVLALELGVGGAGDGDELGEGRLELLLGFFLPVACLLDAGDELLALGVAKLLGKGDARGGTRGERKPD